MRGLPVLSIALAVCASYGVDAVYDYGYPSSGGYQPAPMCGYPAPGTGNPPPRGHPGKPPCKQDTLFGISNTITSRIVKQIIDSRDSNKYQSFTISVFNILHVILLLTNAACGQTLQQLLNYLGIYNLSHINSEFKNYRPQLQQNVTTDGQQEALIRTYAALFPADNFTLVQAYVRKMKQFYGADVQSLPYATNSSYATKTINDKIEENTFGLLKNFFPEPLDPNTILVACATLYLRLSWKQDYFHQTREAPFYQLGTKATTLVRYLNNGQGVGAVASAVFDRYKFIEIPTYLAQFTMIAFYPEDKREDPAKYVRTLTRAKIGQIFDKLGNMTGCKVNVTIPQFRVDSTYSNLIGYFEAGNVTDLFERADLCKGVVPSSKSDKLKDSLLVHKASVTVDRYGLTAVAATAAGVTTTAVLICTQKPEQFYADRPFAFIVADRKNNEALFIGVVYKP